MGIRFSLFSFILITCMSSCYFILLSENKVKIDNDIEGIWEEVTDDETDSDVFELEIIDDYLVHAYDLNDGFSSKKLLYEITLHEIENYRFITLGTSSENSVTLLLSKFSDDEIIFKSFSLNSDVDFEDIGDSQKVKEIVFKALVAEEGIEEGDDEWTFKRMYPKREP